MVKKIKNSLLDLNTIQNKELSIQFSLDGFSFCVKNLDLDEFVSFTNHPFLKNTQTPAQLLENVIAVFKNDTDLHLKYSSVKVIHENNLVSFVPKNLFKEDHIKDYISFNNKLFDNDYFTYDEILHQEMNAVFIPYVNVNNFLIDQFGSFVYRHFSSILVETLLNYHASKNEITFFVNVSKTHFEIIVSKNKKLLLFNTFNHITKEDFIYYILFTLEQLKLNPETVNLNLLGLINFKSDLYQILYKYVRNVSFIDDKFNFNKQVLIDNQLIREHLCLFHF